MIDKDFPGQGKKTGILGVPLGFGAGQTGSELGIKAMRLSKIRGKRLEDHISELGYENKDYGDIKITLPDIAAEDTSGIKHFPEWIHNAEKICEEVGKILDDGRMLVLLSGDHSCAAATVSGISSHFKKNNEEIGLIWFDAHADMNTPETSPSGNIHGMPLAAVLGKGNEKIVNLCGFSPKINPKTCAHIGGRDFDLGEKRLIRELGMEKNFFTMSDIDKRGMPQCVEKALKIAKSGSGKFAVTFDVDIIDPRFAPGSGTLVRGGITYREAHLALEIIAEAGGMQSFEIVEVNPLLDSSNITVELAGELILSALGKTIL